jgi:hypothetical protein
MIGLIKTIWAKINKVFLAIYKAWYGYYSHSINRYKEQEK